ncbi:MAG: hypothetical protein ACT443_04745 [Gemmatimonadota bacterium]
MLDAHNRFDQHIEAPVECVQAAIDSVETAVMLLKFSVVRAEPAIVLVKVRSCASSLRSARRHRCDTRTDR